MSKFNPGWRVLYTKPRHEKQVSSRLAELDIKHLMPTKKTVRIWHDRKKIIDMPLFPSYIFIYLNNMQEYYNGIDAKGVLYYIRCGKEIAQVNETVINNIRLVSEQEKDVEVSEDYIQPGRKLIIRQGALTGLSCEVVQFNDKQKILVRVELLMRNILITLPSEHLIAV